MVEITVPPGVARGATEAEHSGRWYDSNNVRWRDGRLMALGGVDCISSAPHASTVRSIFTSRDNTNIPRIFLGLDNGLTVVEGSAVTNITPTAFVGAAGSAGLAKGFGVGPFGKGKWGTARLTGTQAYTQGIAWSIDSYGSDVLFVAGSDGRLLRWSAASPAVAVTVVPTSPNGLAAMVVTAERHVVCIAGRRVMWSDRENVAGWDFTNVTGQAGFLDILDAPSLLVTAKKVRDGTLIFSETTLDLLQYTGAPLFYGLHRVANGISLLSPNCVAAVNSQAYWMGRNGFYAYDSGSAAQLPCEVAGAVFSADPTYGIDPIYGRLYAHAEYHGQFDEVWFHYPSIGSRVCNRVAVYNPTERWWALHNTLSRTAMCSAGVYRTPIVAGTDNCLYQIDTTSVPDAAAPVYVESNSVAPGGQAVLLRGELDNGSGDPAATRITVLARQTRDGPAKVFGPYIPNSANGYTPMRAGGTDLRIRIEANQPTGFSIGKMRFTIESVGNR